MRHFLNVGTWDPMPLLMQLQTRPSLWDEFTYRTSFEGTPFRGMSDILLRYSATERHLGNADPMACVNDREMVNYDAWGALSEAHEVIYNLMRKFKAVSLGRVIVARLPMGGTIRPHADNYGAYALQPGGLRFHAVVQAAPGCLFHCGDETVQMRSGEVWWFNHKEIHSAENNSADERLHLLIDMQQA